MTTEIDRYRRVPGDEFSAMFAAEDDKHIGDVAFEILRQEAPAENKAADLEAAQAIYGEAERFAADYLVVVDHVTGERTPAAEHFAAGRSPYEVARDWLKGRTDSGRGGGVFARDPSRIAVGDGDGWSHVRIVAHLLDGVCALVRGEFSESDPSLTVEPVGETS